MRRVYSNFIMLGLSFLIACPVFSQTLPTATEISNAMTIGWNIGNSLEATGCNPAQYETCWGNPAVDQQLIDAVKEAGFNTIRIPCSWDQFANQSNYDIEDNWLARVKQVVDYCYANDMYVMLNIHWDGGWLEENCNPGPQASVNEKQEAYWQQIANYFKDYDEHLLFASANEPNVDDATQMAVLMSYHQTFVNTVRATGGNNSSRTLIIQGPRTDIGRTYDLMNNMPTDQIEDRLMLEVHYYTPWNFCGMTQDESWGQMAYFWGEDYQSTTNPSRNSAAGEETVEADFQKMKTKFSDHGIPVIVGEFGAIKRESLSGADYDLHIASREYYYNYVSKACTRYGFTLVYWDAGYLGNNNWTIFDRNNGNILDQGALDALIDGAPDGVALDCNGDPNGEASIDNCGVCSGGNTGTTPNSTCEQDCNGVWDGTAVVDPCGKCTGGNTDQIPCDVSVTNGIYVLKSENSGLCMAPGTPVTQQTCDGSTNQMWQVTETEGTYTFVNLNTGDYFSYAGTTAGDNVNTTASSTNSGFTLESDGDGSYLLVTNNTDLVVDISGGSTAPGINALLWTRTGGENQLFSFEEVTDVDCNGEINGTATYDACGVCSGGNTGVIACTILEAESACEFEGAVENNWTGFTGTGFVNTTNMTGAHIVLSIQSTSAQSNVELTFTFANGGAAARPANVNVNGTGGLSLNFTSTGAWDNWQTEAIWVDLEQGVNIIELTATTANGIANLDHIYAHTTISQGICEQDCAGIWGGSEDFDDCGVCGGTNACLDCAGTPNGDAFYDDCNDCVGGTTGVDPCEQDCHGDFGGTAAEDACGTCAGGNTGVDPVTDPQDCIATSVDKYENQITLAYPNPTSGELHLSEKFDWQLMDITGAVLDKGTSNHLSLSFYAPGVYFLKLDSELLKIIKK